MSALVGAATTACSVFVKTTELAAVAAVHSVDPERWWTEFSAVIDRIAPRFARYESLRHAAGLMAGMVSGPCPTGLIMLTVNEFRRLFDALLLTANHTVTSLLAWSRWRRRHQYRARQSHYKRRQHQ